MVTGLSLRTEFLPLITLLILTNIGYAFAVVQVITDTKAVIWVCVSAFLAATAVFYAAMLGSHTERRLYWLMRGYLAAAVVASALAIGGYFHLLGGLSEMFLRYERARGPFNDPNVLGAFLVMPVLFEVRRVLVGNARTVLRSGAVLLILLAAMFLSFSRASWGQVAGCSLFLMAITFVTSRSASERTRIVMIAVLGAILIAAFIAALLSIHQVADLFKERASLEQSYDTGYLGRFGRYVLGMELALDRPLGIGPLQFAKIFPEDPHNAYLNAFMSGGWLTGVSYFTLTLLTVLTGFCYLGRTTPWQPLYHVVYAAYLGTIGESAIIDSDHWRHYFLQLGVLWGLIAATRRYHAGRAAPIG